MQAEAGGPQSMYGSVSRQGFEGGPVDPGAIVIISTLDASQTFLGDPTANPNDGVSGLTFDNAQRLYGTVVSGGGGSVLIEIDPNTGNLLNTIGPIQFPGNVDTKIADLANDPITDQLYGYTSGGPLGAQLVTINKLNGAAAGLGPFSPVTGAIGFAPDGTLYFVDKTLAVGVLQTLNPANGAVLTTFQRSLAPELDALGVRADGTIFVAQSNFQVSLGEFIYTLQPNGAMVLVGGGLRPISDIAFGPTPVPPGGNGIPVGGEFIPLDTTMVLLAGTQTTAAWMIPVIVSAIGIAIVIARKF